MCLVLIDGQSASHFTAWIVIPNRDCLAPFMYPLFRFFHPFSSFLPSSVRGMLRRFPRLYPSFALSSSSEFSESSPSVCFLDLPNSIRFRENSDNTMSRTRSLCVFLFPIKFSLNITIIFREILLLFLHAADPSEYFSFLRYPSSLSSSCL